MNKSSVEDQFNQIDKNNGWVKTYQYIREQSDKEANEQAFTINHSKKSINLKLNRYRDVNPYDHSRISLKRGDTDYINGNLVKMEKANRKYILTQGPLELTVGHFWLMIYEQKSKAILMLNKLVESRQVKCHKYWPEGIGPEYKMNLTDVNLTLEYLKCEEFTNFSKRYLRLTDLESNTSREIIQFHYTTWPDFGIPTSPNAFLQFLAKVRQSGALDDDVGPAVVHCSAGIGRSGTFCLVDSCLVLIDKEGSENVSVTQVLLELRRYRMGLIQTSDQLYFSYQAILEGIKLLNKSDFNDNEVPVVSVDNESDNLPPPPPPPPRTESLQPGFRSIPISASAHEFFNFENGETRKSTRNTAINCEIERPLPPLPMETILAKVDEFVSDIVVHNNKDPLGQFNNVTTVDDNDSENDEVINESDDSVDTEDEDNDIHKNDNMIQDTTKATKIDVKIYELFDANATLPPTPIENGLNVKKNTETVTLISDAAELRRRKRLERNLALEDKIKEIKRKQKESEANAGTGKKRRSIIYIAAGVGVVVGLVCVYAYTKFG